MNPTTVIFDLGGVLIDYNPRYLFRKVFDNEKKMEDFLKNICTPEWNVAQDAGRPIAEAVAELHARHPDMHNQISAYYGRWLEMLNGAIEGTVDILGELRTRKTPLYALTNFSSETFPLAWDLFDFLAWFEDILVSGQEKLLKPDPAIYQRLLERNGLRASECVFIDDVPENVAGAEAVGLRAVLFRSPEKLRQDLENFALL